MDPLDRLMESSLVYSQCTKPELIELARCKNSFLVQQRLDLGTQQEATSVLFDIREACGLKRTWSGLDKRVGKKKQKRVD